MSAVSHPGCALLSTRGAATFPAPTSRWKSRLPGQAPAAAGTPSQITISPLSPAQPTATVTPNPRVASGVNTSLGLSVPHTPRLTIVKTDGNTQTRYHIVTGGDTLAKISSQYYGTTARWADILAANRDILGENNNLVVGRTLRIP